MELLKNTRKKNSQFGVTIIALTIVVLMLLVLGSVTVSIISSDTSILDKTNQDTAEYNEQVENYQKEYRELTERIDSRENQVDTLPEDF